MEERPKISNLRVLGGRDEVWDVMSSRSSPEVEGTGATGRGEEVISDTRGDRPPVPSCLDEEGPPLVCSLIWFDVLRRYSNEESLLFVAFLS